MSIQRLAACHPEVLAGRLHEVSLAVTGEVRPPVSCVLCLTPSQSPFPGAVAQCGSHSSHGGAHGSLEHGHPCLFLSPQPLEQELATHFSDWKTEAWGFLISNLWVLKQSESFFFFFSTHTHCILFLQEINRRNSQNLMCPFVTALHCPLYLGCLRGMECSGPDL